MGDVEQIEEHDQEFSRRTFIKGVIATGASVSASSYVLRGGTVVRAQAPGAVERLVTLTVNGQQRRVDVLPQETLATTLRYKLGLTGTKIGCDRSECGACTVLIAGVPHYSCSILTHQVRGRTVLTIEGLEAPGWHAAPGAAGGGGRAGVPVCVLHAGICDEHGGAGRGAAERDARGGGAPSVGEPVPVCGLQQDLERRDEGWGIQPEGLTWLTTG